MLARLAGDEFAIVVHATPTTTATLEFARRCARVGSEAVTLDGLEIVVTVSVGVAFLMATDDDALQPMRRADIAMYNAKWQRTGVEHYRDEIDRRTPARLSMLGDLRAAIEGDATRCRVSAETRLGDRARDRCRGAGALGASRRAAWWRRAEFVRVAEDTGLIKELTDLVLARGIAMLRRLELTRTRTRVWPSTSRRTTCSIRGFPIGCADTWRSIGVRPSR